MQLQSVFRGESCPVASPALTGEVLCFYDDLPICRGIVSRGGTSLDGYVPKVARTMQLTRLLT